MRALSAILAAVLVSVSLLASPMTIKGELVEIACMKNGSDSSGAEHKTCAVSCARGGAALGILTDDDVVEIVGEYTANRNARLLEFIAEEVLATGEVTESDGKLVINVTAMKVAK